MDIGEDFEPLGEGDWLRRSTAEEGGGGGGGGGESTLKFDYTHSA